MKAKPGFLQTTKKDRIARIFEELILSRYT